MVLPPILTASAGGLTQDILLIGLCILLGAIIKLLDQIIDIGRAYNHKMWVAVIALIIPISLTYLAVTEGPVIGMVVGTVIGLILTRKIDHPAYIASIGFFFLFVFMTLGFESIQVPTETFLIIPVAAAGSFLDEFGHDRWKSGNKYISFFLEHRFFLKIFAFIGMLVGFAQFIHFLGFLSFDIAYDITNRLYSPDGRGFQ